MVNHKRVDLLYAEAALQVKRRKRKKIPWVNVSRCFSDQVWSMDFVHDQLSDGRRFRILNVVDDVTRECVGQLVETSNSGERVRYLDQLMDTRSKPRSIVCDNGSSPPE